MPRTIVTVAVIWLTAVGCKDKPDPAQQVRDVIKAGESAANDGKADAVGALIDTDYEDNEGRDRARMISLVRRHLGRHRNRFVHARILSVDVDDDEAKVSLILALAGQQIGEDDDLLKVSADLLKVEAELQRAAAGWQVTSATWRRPSPLDVL